MNADRARKITTKSEYDLIRGAAANRVNELSPARLRAAVLRARKLRDKYRTMGRKQGAARRAKGAGRGGETAANTRDKVQLFEQAMERYQKAAARADRAAAPAKTGKKRAKPASTARKSKKAATSAGKNTTRAKRSTKIGAKSGTKSVGKSGTKSGAKKAGGRAAAAKSSSYTSSPIRAKPVSRLLARAGAPALNGEHATGGQQVGTVDVVERTRVRDQARVSYSVRTLGPRLENIHAATANARIRGHALGSHRAAQGKRDAQQRGD